MHGDSMSNFQKMTLSFPQRFRNSHLNIHCNNGYFLELQWLQYGNCTDKEKMYRGWKY